MRRQISLLFSFAILSLLFSCSSSNPNLTSLHRNNSDLDTSVDSLKLKMAIGLEATPFVSEKTFEDEFGNTHSTYKELPIDFINQYGAVSSHLSLHLWNSFGHLFNVALTWNTFEWLNLHMVYTFQTKTNLFSGGVTFSPHKNIILGAGLGESAYYNLTRESTSGGSDLGLSTEAQLFDIEKRHYYELSIVRGKMIMYSQIALNFQSQLKQVVLGVKFRFLTGSSPKAKTIPKSTN